MPDNAYGNVVEAAFKQAVGAQGRRASSRSNNIGADRARCRRGTVAQALGAADALFIADDGDARAGGGATR